MPMISINPRVREISILMVGDMFSMLPSSKVDGSSMGFLNQLT